MLFKRKNRKSFFAHVRNLFWPSMGWSRTVEYIKHRILRLPASNHSIAFGLASGCVVSWTPLFGFHIIQCLVLCFIGRGNYLAGLLGTTFGNPWTFPILLWISYKVGMYALVFLGYSEYAPIDQDMMSKDVLADKATGIFVPTLVGSYIMMAISFPLFYVLFLSMIKAGRATRKKVADKVHDFVDHRKEVKASKENKKK
jgi:hypothetical protein